MFNVEDKGGFDVVLPVAESLTRETIHQVDADVADARLPEYPDGLDYLFGGMSAVEVFQSPVIEGLCTHAYAIYRQSL